MRFYREFLSNPMILFILILNVLGVCLICVSYMGYYTLLMVALGLLIYAVIEYVVHRYLLHEFPKLVPILYRGHVNHHQHPAEIKYLFGSVVYDAVGYCLYFLLLFLVTRQFSIVVSIMTGTAIFQMYYQWMHFIAHRPITLKTRWSRWMKKKHLLHHYQDEHLWYGVSNPGLDYVMGSNKSKPLKPIHIENKETTNRSPDI